MFEIESIIHLLVLLTLYVPALNYTTFRAGILMDFPVAGFRPVRAARDLFYRYYIV